MKSWTLSPNFGLWIILGCPISNDTPSYQNSGLQGVSSLIRQAIFVSIELSLGSCKILMMGHIFWNLVSHHKRFLLCLFSHLNHPCVCSQSGIQLNVLPSDAVAYAQVSSCCPLRKPQDLNPFFNPLSENRESILFLPISFSFPCYSFNLLLFRSDSMVVASAASSSCTSAVACLRNPSPHLHPIRDLHPISNPKLREWERERDSEEESIIISKLPLECSSLSFIRPAAPAYIPFFPSLFTPILIPLSFDSNPLPLIFLSLTA